LCREYKSNTCKTIWILSGKSAEERDSSVNNPNIYHVEWDNRLSPFDLQPLTTGSALKIMRERGKGGRGGFQFRNCIIYTGNYFVVFCKTKHSNIIHLKSSFGIIKQLLPSYNVSIKLSTICKTTKQPPSGWQLSMFTSYESNNCILFLYDYDWLNVVERQMSRISAMSWREQVTFDEMMMMYSLYQTYTLSRIFIVLAHWNNNPWIVISPHSDTLSWFW